MRCIVVAGFLLTSTSRDPSAIAELLVHLWSWIYLQAEADPDRSTDVIPNSAEEDQWSTVNMELCTSAASDGSHVALSRHQLSSLFDLFICRHR